MDSRYCGSASLSSVPLFSLLLSSLCFFSSGIFGRNLARYRCGVGSSHRMVMRGSRLRLLRPAKILRVSPNALSFSHKLHFRACSSLRLARFLRCFCLYRDVRTTRAGLQSGLRDRRWLSFTFPTPFALCLAMECPQFFVTLFHLLGAACEVLRLASECCHVETLSRSFVTPSTAPCVGCYDATICEWNATRMRVRTKECRRRSRYPRRFRTYRV